MPQLLSLLENFPVPLKFLIYKQGSIVYAMNGQTGEISHWGTSAYTVIQKAINSLTNGGLIYIKSGTYDLSAPLSVLLDNVHIIGEKGTVLRINAAASYCITVGAQSATTLQCSNVYISDLTLDGYYPTVSDSGGISISACENVLVERVVFQNIGYRNVASIWSETEYSKRNVVFRDCFFNKCGIVLGGGEHIIIDNCRFSGTLSSPNAGNNAVIDFGFGELDSSMLRDSWVRNCHFYQCKRNAGVPAWSGVIAGFQRTEYCGIVDNYFYDGDGVAIVQSTVMSPGKTFSSNNVTVRGNQIKGTGALGVLQNGIVLYKGSYYQILENNIADIVNQGIQILDTTASGFLISKNVIKGMGQSGITLQGTKHVVTGNVIVDVSTAAAWNYINMNANSTTYCVVSGNQFINSGGAVGRAVVEWNANDYNIIADNILTGAFLAPAIFRTGANTVIKRNIGFATEADILSATFAIDALGVKTVAIAHGLAITPAIQDCHLSVVENTAVDDWAFNLLKVVSVDAANVTVKINVSTASVTAGATAKLGLKVGNP